MKFPRQEWETRGEQTQVHLEILNQYYLCVKDNKQDAQKSMTVFKICNVYLEYVFEKWIDLCFNYYVLGSCYEQRSEAYG
jgi:hypothetical protein